MVIEEGPDMIRRGIEAAKKEKEVVMAFGSLYLAGDILKTYKMMESQEEQS